MAGLPFSKFREANGLIYTSGQVYLTPEGKLLEGSIDDKINQVMKNLEGLLIEAGTSFSKVIKTTIYVTDMTNYGKVNEVYAKYFSEPYPAREVVCVKELPLGAEVEISMVASKN
jgi:2-iminobutanoate/2-iminopropanoate deaminase